LWSEERFHRGKLLDGLSAATASKAA